MHENEVIQCWLYFNCGIGIWEKLLIWFMLWKNNRFCRNVQYKLRFCLCCNITAKLRVKIAAFSFFFLTPTYNRCQAVVPQVPILQKSLYLPRQLLLLKISTFQQKRPILGYFSFVWRRRQIFSLTFLTNQMRTDVFTSWSNKGALLQIKYPSVSPSWALYTITGVHAAFIEKWMGQMVRVNILAQKLIYCRIPIHVTFYNMLFEQNKLNYFTVVVRLHSI